MSEYQEETKKGNTAYIAVIALLAIGLGVIAFLWSKEKSALNDCTTKNQSLESDINGINAMMSGYSENMTQDLKSDFQNMLDTYDKLKAKDASQADSINAQKEKIQNLMNELNSSKKLSASQLYTLRKENETLRNIMKGYVKQIDSLNTLNLKLNSDLENTTYELNETSAQRDQYKNDADAANEKVKRGSKLQAYGFKSSGLRMKLNNTTEETNKAKSASMVKSQFTIGENTIATSGKKVVYLQVINPDGKTLQSKSTNTVLTDEGTIAFSDKKEIDYNNQAIDVAIYYTQDGTEFIKGTYKVRIYCDGQMIGTDAFTLK